MVYIQLIYLRKFNKILLMHEKIRTKHIFILNKCIIDIINIICALVHYILLFNCIRSWIVKKELIDP